MKNLNKIVMFLVLFVIFTSCKTITKYVENTRNTSDSIENVQLKTNISTYQKQIVTLTSQIQTVKDSMYSAIEKLNISESEKQALKESYETTVKKYNEKGILIEETTTKKISEYQKEITKYEEQLKKISGQLLLTEIKYSSLRQIDSLKSDSIAYLNKQLTSNNTSETNINNTVKKDVFSFKSALIGALVFALLEIVFFLLWKIYGAKFSVFIKGLKLFK